MEKSRAHKRASVWHIGDIYRLLRGTHHHAAVKVDADSCGETPCVVQLKHVWGLYGAMGQWGQGLAEPCGIFPPLGSSVSPPSSIGAQLSLRVGGTR